MSLLSDGEKALMNALANGVKAITNELSLEPATKAAITSAITNATSQIENEATTVAQTVVGDVTGSIVASTTGGDPAVVVPATVAASAGEPLTTIVENDVGVVGESLVDAEITKVAGPLAPAAIIVANALITMLGGEVEQAIAALFHAKANTTTAPTVNQVTAAVKGSITSPT